MGRVWERSHVFPRDKVDEYWEGYCTYSKPIVHYSELGCGVPDQGSKESTLCQELLGVIDSQNKFAPMAFGEKGKIRIEPELVGVDSNNPLLGFTDYMNFPAASLRRFVFVEVTVLPQFRKSDSTSIDPDKCIEAGGHSLDRYTWNVYRYEPIDGKKSTKKYILITDNVDVFSQCMVHLFGDHIRRQENVVNMDLDKFAAEYFDD
jgi:hypothetical protein